MRNRIFSCLAIFLCLFGVHAMAADAPVEGKDYQLLTPPQPTSAPGKIVVMEFFSYQCSHCFTFHPFITSWAKRLPADVVFEQIPVSLGNRSWAPIAQSFYALQALGKLEQLDRLIFNAIHTQSIKLNTEADIIAFVSRHGVNAAEFTTAFNSFGVKSSMARAEQQMRTHRVQGTPAIVVDGKYIILNDGIKSYEELLTRTDRVVAKIRAEKARK